MAAPTEPPETARLRSRLERERRIRHEAETIAEVALRDLYEKRQALAAESELRQELDRQVREAQKMAALGGLVAGIAHEINTPIGIAVTAASSLDDETRRLASTVEAGTLKRSALAAYVEVTRELTRLMLSNLDRASALIQGFKQVAVDQSSEQRRQFAVRDYLREVMQSVSPRLKKTRLTVTIVCDDQLVLDSYPGALSQIVTNLVTNSLTHAYGPDDAGTIRLQVIAVPGGVRMTYADDGRGIPAQHLDRIFDPFFTTRRGQGGSGLGLHIVYSLVTQRLHGQVRCESQEGAGTTFTINLPDLSDTPQ